MHGTHFRCARYAIAYSGGGGGGAPQQGVAAPPPPPTLGYNYTNSPLLPLFYNSVAVLHTSQPNPSQMLVTNPMYVVLRIFVHIV